MNQEDLYLNIINSLRDGVYYVDAQKKILFWNKAAELITGYSADEIVGKRCQETPLNHIDNEGRPICVVGCPLYASIIDGKQRTDDVFARHKDGHRIPIRVNVFPIFKNGKTAGAFEIFSQNSRETYEGDLVDRLSGIAMHDALTGLPNRRYLESFLDCKLGEFGRFNQKFAVLFADIDDFSCFNNKYGHQVGDMVLRSIAAGITKSSRVNDLVGRWGGEEFVGIYSIKKDCDASIIAEKLRALVESTQITHESETLSITVSMGVAIVKKEDTAKSIVDRADRLMYKSKQSGKNRVSLG